MKKTASIMCLVLAMFMAMTVFTACGDSENITSDGDSVTTTGIVDSLDGTYDLVKMIEGDQVIDKDALEALEQNGQKVTLVIQGNSAIMTSWNNTELLTVDTSAKTMTDSTGFSPSYVLNGNTLTLLSDEATMVFEKQ